MQTGSEWDIDEYPPSYHVASQSIHPIQVPGSCSTQYVTATIYKEARIRFDGEDSEDSSSESNDNVAIDGGLSGEEDLMKQYRSIIKKRKPVKRLSVRSVLSEFLGCKSMPIIVVDD